VEPERDPNLEAVKRNDRKHEAARAAASRPLSPEEADRIRALCREARRLIAERLDASRDAAR
jgi:hypothetical protein